jgi:hypothetical protein
LIVPEITIATIIMETRVSISVMPACREGPDNPIVFMSNKRAPDDARFLLQLLGY